jgi:hypothetical protein
VGKTRGNSCECLWCYWSRLRCLRAIPEIVGVQDHNGPRKTAPSWATTRSRTNRQHRQVNAH